jgi:hypothetical protein
MSDKQKIQLVIHLDPLTSIYADKLNYILITKTNFNQALKNGYHQYFRSLADLFDELFEHRLINTLADGQDKTISEMLEIINKTRKETKELIRPFEERTPA